MYSVFLPGVQLTGILLVVGLVSFLIGAGGWRPKAYQAALPQALPVMAADRRRMRWIYTWMVLGVVTSTTGMACLRDLLVQAGAGVLATVALVLFAFGGALWVVALLFHLTVGEHAAAETVRTGEVPPWFVALHRWAGALYAVQMELCYVSWIALGGAILQSSLLSPGLGWTCIGCGAVYAIGFLATGGGPFAPPFWVHTIPGVAGLLLLLK